MATGYGYVKDSKPLQIDWQSVGEKMSLSIDAEVKDRQSRKDKINESLAKYNKDLLNQPQGTNAESNRFMSDFSSDAGNAMREAKRLLRGGNMSERDFYKFRANATQGTDLMFEAGKKFNAGYDEAMKRFESGESQAKENFMRQQTEGYLNFANNGAYINPLTGEVNVARRDKETGEISTDPNDFANASELVQQATRQYNSFNVTQSIKGAVDGLATTLVTEGDGRSVKQLFQAMNSDPKAQALLDKAKADMIASFTVNPDNVSSILTGNLGGYDFTYSEVEAAKDDSLILLNPDGTNNFESTNGKKQKLRAEEFMQAQFEAALGGETKERQELTEIQKVNTNQSQQQINQAQQRIDNAETQNVVDNQLKGVASVQADLRILETERKNREAERIALLKIDQNKRKGSVIFADPAAAFEDYIKADDIVKVGLFSKDIDESIFSPNTVATKEIIQPLVKKFGDLGFSFTLNNTQDFFTIVGPSGGEGLRIDYDEDENDAGESYQKMMTYIRGEFKDDESLVSKYSIIGYDPYGPGSYDVDASGRPTNRGVGGKYNKE